MNENAAKVQGKFVEVEKLVSKFGSQSEQLHDAQDLLQISKQELQESKEELRASKDKLEELIAGIYGDRREAKRWYEQTTAEIGDVCYKFDESFGALQNAFDEQNFKELCSKIAELTRILDECQALKNDLLDMTITVVEEVNKKLEAEMTAIRAKQEEDRAFMEAKFAELLERLAPPPPVPASDT